MECAAGLALHTESGPRSLRHVQQGWFCIPRVGPGARWISYIHAVLGLRMHTEGECMGGPLSALHASQAHACIDKMPADPAH